MTVETVTSAVDIDPLDAGMPGPESAGRWPARNRPALGLRPVPAGGFAILVAGWALGPEGLRVLTTPLLDLIEPAVSMALALIGLSAGLDVRWNRGERRLLGIATTEAAITCLSVAAGVLAAGGLPV